MNKLMIPNPLSGNENTIQVILEQLASQEGCDGEPYDQMVIAAAYIDFLEARLKVLWGEDILSDLYKMDDNLKKLVDKIRKDGVLEEKPKCKICGFVLAGSTCINESCTNYCPF